MSGYITDVGRVNNSGSPSRPSCGEGMVSGVSILKFGKTLPLIELFEAFIVVGSIAIISSTSIYFTFKNVSTILQSEGGTPKSVQIANAAASAQPVWIAIGVLLFVIGIVLYVIHRRLQNSPS